ncbi:hypothetical protein DFH09DRAFT_1091776 [Mycena vulgaris]|nr:hypothetical protein DFH09DRAFT_1091776 [Mycena vulgaris]
MLQLTYEVIRDIGLEPMKISNAPRLSVGVLTDSHSDSLAGILKPTDKSARTQYLAAFDAALRRRIPQSCPGEPIHPARIDDDPKFFLQLGLMPIGVSNKCLDIMHRPGVQGHQGFTTTTRRITAVWDAETELVTLAMPKACTVHPEEKCLCWIGQSLQDADGLHGVPALEVIAP